MRLQAYLLFAFLLLAVLPAQAHNAHHDRDSGFAADRINHEVPVVLAECPQKGGNGCCCTKPSAAKPASELRLMVALPSTLFLLPERDAVRKIPARTSAIPLATLLMYLIAPRAPPALQ